MLYTFSLYIRQRPALQLVYYFKIVSLDCIVSNIRVFTLSPFLKINTLLYVKSIYNMSLFEIDETEKILLLGEGNFSFSCCLLKLMRKKCGTLSFSNFYTTCFQKELSSLALSNVNFLKSQGAEVFFGVDATKLEDQEPFKFLKFSKIIFNFPHVGGKMKIHLNRALLCNFFTSCSCLLTPDGIVMVTLCAGQGGTGFEGNIRRWDDTWQIVEQAAHGSLVLAHIEYFPCSMFADYQPVGYRGREQKFSITSSVLHVFKKVSGPIQHISLDAIFDVANYHILEDACDVAVSYSHKSAILKNPLKNQLSPQYFLLKKLHDIVDSQGMNIQNVFNFPYHTAYDEHKASCFFKGSLFSLRSSLVEVMPVFLNNFITEGLIFSKFDSDFSNIGVNCQALLGGPFMYASIKDFFVFIAHSFNCDQNIILEENDNECNVFIKDDSGRKKVAYRDALLNCITIDIDRICLFLFKVSMKELWARDTKFDGLSYRLILPSLFPPEFVFDISFATKDDLDEVKFFNLLHQNPDGLIDSVQLLSVYQHPNTTEKSYCYRLKYKSYEKPLYRKLVIDIHHNIIRKLLEIILNVTVH